MPSALAARRPLQARQSGPNLRQKRRSLRHVCRRTFRPPQGATKPEPLCCRVRKTKRFRREWGLWLRSEPGALAHQADVTFRGLHARLFCQDADASSGEGTLHAASVNQNFPCCATDCRAYASAIRGCVPDAPRRARLSRKPLSGRLGPPRISIVGPNSAVMRLGARLLTATHLDDRLRPYSVIKMLGWIEAHIKV